MNAASLEGAVREGGRSQTGRQQLAINGQIDPTAFLTKQGAVLRRIPGTRRLEPVKLPVPNAVQAIDNAQALVEKRLPENLGAAIERELSK